MPELAEVEIQSRMLSRRLRGTRIRAIEVRDPKIQLRDRLIGRTIRRIWRRAKFIIFDLTGDRHLLVHLRMTGWFEFVQPARYRLAIVTAKGAAYFADSRRFGTVAVLRGDELRRALAHLGPEPLARSCDLTRLARTRRPIKVALLDQRLIAGVGNIYANEALWRARLDPRRPANRLQAKERQRLQHGIRAALRKGIAYGPQIFEVQTFTVYDRALQPCRRCGTRIRRVVLAQRSTFFCPRCQR